MFSVKKNITIYNSVQFFLPRVTVILLTSMILLSCVSITERVPKKREFTFAQVCDTQLGKGGYEHDLKTFEQTVVQINKLNPDFVVICGDLVARPLEKSVRDFKRIKAGFKIPCYCVPGNHDVFNAVLTRKGMTAEESLSNYRRDFGKDYYSFEHKGYSFICVNSQLWRVYVKGESEKHDQWLKTVLEKSSKRGVPVFIIAHHPLYVKEPNEAYSYSNIDIDKRLELLELFVKHGVVAILTGHTHSTVINNYKDIQLVTGEATSWSKGALGFRLWMIEGKRPFKSIAIPLEGY